jgi:rhodanese-related sulfurtransferase
MHRAHSLTALAAATLLLAMPLRAETTGAVAPPAPPSIRAAVVGEATPKTPEVSTAELEDILAQHGALILDARPRMEWAISHIPGALNVAPKPGMPMSQYTSDAAEVARLTQGNKAQPLVLYCNGPFCGKSKRLAEDLLAAGYLAVRRYQLGAPVWRALGGVMVIEPEAVRHVVESDRTAVFLDVREPAEFAAGTLAGARNLPRSRVLEAKDTGEIKAAKDDGRLPMEDHNTRIVVFGGDGAQARAVAEGLAREAFHNVSYFEGGAADLLRVLR